MSDQAMPRSCRRDLLLAAGIALFSAGYLLLSGDIRQPAFSDPLGPRAFPRLVGTIGLLCSLWLALEALVRSRRAQAEHVAEEDGEGEFKPVLVLAVMAWSLIYYMTFETAGFVPCSIVYMLGLTMAFNRSMWLVNMVYSIVLPIVVFVAFDRLLGIYLPRGPLGF